jgi:hypothetical protein
MKQHCSTTRCQDTLKQALKPQLGKLFNEEEINIVYEALYYERF